ncbi:MAG: hypothetical protein DME20_00540 [Verrucomicrobia bacterium]|nr:MAG: hypothetical protein DME20_00540 [Verrucomicrobiota bacterium]
MSGRWRAILGRIVAVGGFVGWLVSMLLFFGFDAKTIGKAWQTMSTHYVFAIVSAVFFLIFVGALYYLWKNSRITPENVEPRIREWLDAFSLGTRKLTEPAHHFAYEVMAHTGIPLVVLRTREHPRYITLFSKIGLGPKHMDLLNKLSQSDRARFKGELILQAAKAKIGYQADSTFENVTIEKRLPITSDLSEANLMDGISEIHFSALVIINTIALTLETRNANPVRGD